MKIGDIPVRLVPAAGVTQEDDDGLNYLRMPSGMSSYRPPSVPESDELVGRDQALTVLKDTAAALTRCLCDGTNQRVDLSSLDADNRAVVDQMLGEGEVSIVIDGGQPARIQESVFAGVWRVSATGDVAEDWLEIGPIPALALQHSLEGEVPGVDLSPAPAGVTNAGPVLMEVVDKSAHRQTDAAASVINLSLLPMSPEDLAFLDARLGRGPVTILSRGYGNCRITGTALPQVWWVQYFNSTDALILNTIEIVHIPEVACAAREDLEDSAERFAEVLDTVS